MGVSGTEGNILCEVLFKFTIIDIFNGGCLRFEVELPLSDDLKDAKYSVGLDIFYSYKIHDICTIFTLSFSISEPLMVVSICIHISVSLFHPDIYLPITVLFLFCQSFLFFIRLSHLSFLPLPFSPLASFNLSLFFIIPLFFCIFIAGSKMYFTFMLSTLYRIDCFCLQIGILLDKSPIKG